MSAQNTTPKVPVSSPPDKLPIPYTADKTTSVDDLTELLSESKVDLPKDETMDNLASAFGHKWTPDSTFNGTPNNTFNVPSSRTDKLPTPHTNDKPTSVDDLTEFLSESKVDLPKDRTMDGLASAFGDKLAPNRTFEEQKAAFPGGFVPFDYGRR